MAKTVYDEIQRKLKFAFINLGFAKNGAEFEENRNNFKGWVMDNQHYLMIGTNDKILEWKESVRKELEKAEKAKTDKNIVVNENIENLEHLYNVVEKGKKLTKIQGLHCHFEREKKKIIPYYVFRNSNNELSTYKKTVFEKVVHLLKKDLGEKDIVLRQGEPKKIDGEDELLMIVESTNTTTFLAPGPEVKARFIPLKQYLALRSKYNDKQICLAYIRKNLQAEKQKEKKVV